MHRALPEAPPGIARARVLYELEESEFFTRGALQAVRRSHEALRELERSPEGGLALQASIHFNLALGLRGTRDLSSARQHSEAAVELARRAEDASVLAEATAVAAMLQFDAGEPGSIALGRHALTIAGGPPGLVTHCLGHQLLWSGRFAQARPLFEELQREMSVRGDTNEGVVRWYLANLELRAGNWRQACEHAESVSELAVQNGWVGDSLLLHSSAQLAAYQGDLHAAVTRAHRGVALAEAEGSPFGRAVYGGVLGLVELSRDDHRTACAHLEAANEVLEAAGIREPGLALACGRGDAIEALLGTDEQARARALLAPWEELARSLDRPWPLSVALRCRGLLLGAEKDLPAALAVFEESLAQHRRAEDPYQLARTLLAFGGTQRRAKQRRAARESLERAEALFSNLGAAGWAEKARHELGRIGGRVSSGAALTPRERKFAELVAEGRSNKEIAAALFVTPKSVGTILSRIYAKLGVHSRTELAHLLAQRASKV